MKDDLAPVSRPHRDGTTREESALVDSSRQWMGGSGDTSLEGAPHSQLPAEIVSRAIAAELYSCTIVGGRSSPVRSCVPLLRLTCKDGLR